MIIGIGCDVVHLPRIERVMQKFPQRFPQRILSYQEVEIFYQSTEHNKHITFLAKRFAAKEALVKALGIGFRDGVSFHDITVHHDHYGKPEVTLCGITKQKLGERMPPTMIPSIYISLADDPPVAIAMVVITAVPNTAILSLT